MTFDPDTPILVQEHPECVVVSFLHDQLLDFDTIDATGKALDTLVAEMETPNLILSLPNVKQLSSMAISVLIRTREGCLAKGGTLKLANVSDRVVKVLDLSALTEVFDFYDTEEAARESLA